MTLYRWVSRFLASLVILLLLCSVGELAQANVFARQASQADSLAQSNRSTPLGTRPFVPATVSTSWYFAEGFTGTGYTEYLVLTNFGSVSATVTVKYLLGSGGPITKNYTVLQTSRLTLTVNTEAGSGQNVSMVVTSTQPIVAERPIYFTYTGLSGYTIPGGSDILGATQLGTSYYFGYLDSTAGHDTWLTILNNNSSSLTATMQYFSASGGNPITTTHTISATSRGTVRVSSEGLSLGTYAAVVTLSQAGMVERVLYLQDANTSYTGGADVVGAAPQTSWYFAEGFTSPTSSERYFLFNPSTTTPAVATLTFYLGNGSTAITQMVLAAGQQQIVSANGVLGMGNVNNGAKILATAPILVERFTSMQYSGSVGVNGSATIPCATDVLGTNAPGQTFYFAEGYTGGLFAEWLTLMNPTTSAATVTVTFQPASGGTPTTNTYTVNATSRFQLYTNSVMSNQSFSMKVTSTVTIVAERVMYFNNGGQTGATDVIGYQG